MPGSFQTERGCAWSSGYMAAPFAAATHLLRMKTVCFEVHQYESNNYCQNRDSLLFSLKMPGFLASKVCSSKGASPSGSSLPRLSFSSL